MCCGLLRRYWNEMKWYFPEEVQTANFTAAVALAEEYIVTNFWIFGLIALIIFLNLVCRY